MINGRLLQRIAVVFLTAFFFCAAGFAASLSSTEYSQAQKKKITETPSTKKRLSRVRHKRPPSRRARQRYIQHWQTSSFAHDQGTGDTIAGEDAVVRAAAVDALGGMNGTVVAIDPSNGRILAMVNQKLALSSGGQPCSTIKVAVALAALNENVVKKDTPVYLGGGWQIDMTRALAHSNNRYFELVGQQLGFEKVSQYARQFGLGELAGWNIPGEHLGVFPSQAPAAKLGGVGKMCSFGESISLTPLQLGALMAALANGGTLYYLQHPATPEDVANFQPRVKRYLNIASLIPEVSPGMAGAVQFGTARSVQENFTWAEVLGKTGTCSRDGTRFGWFASYANTHYGRIVAVFFLEGGRSTFGPKAAELAGKFYRNLQNHDYFTAHELAPVHSSGISSGGTLQ
jgi:cell division protein FtsI/penicillin-binding protein 2